MVTIYEQVSRVLNRIIKQNKAQNQILEESREESWANVMQVFHHMSKHTDFLYLQFINY